MKARDLNEILRILLINESSGEDNFGMPHTERWQLFDNWVAAIKAAKSLGWESLFPLDTSVGIANICQYGDVKLTMICLEVQHIFEERKDESH